MYGKTQLNDYLKVENESVEQPSIEEVDTIINELENKLDCLAATRPGMQTTGDVIDSHMVSFVHLAFKINFFVLASK